jgi:hypothetical protein
LTAIQLKAVRKVLVFAARSPSTVSIVLIFRAFFARTLRRPFAAMPLLAMLTLSPALYAQRARTPTLEEILQRLKANLSYYDAKVPSFFCDEHVVSQRQSGTGERDSVTESVFRLKRTANPDHTTTLVESRDIKTVDGKPAVSDDVDGPTLLDGAFEGGLAVVSLTQSVCTNYTLQKINPNRPAEPYAIRFATVVTPENAGQCLLEEDSKGSVAIDPVSLQITHLELTTPHHVILPGNADEPRVVGKRVITVDYAPVMFGAQTYWMPSMIALKATGGSGTFHETVWSYPASYRNFHKLEVTAHIRP